MSKNFNKVKNLYEIGAWDKSRVYDAVKYKWITEDEYQLIIGEEYQLV